MVKLIVGGSTGFVGSEVVHLALQNPAITSIVGLGRRETAIPEGAEHGEKLKSFIVEDFEDYSEEVRKEFEDADACIWTIAITPSKSKDHPWEEVVKVCRCYVLNTVKTIAAVSRKPGQQFRFSYISGHFALRKADKPPQQFEDAGLIRMQMLHMRGEIEETLLAFAQESQGKMQVQISKPGFIAGPGRQTPAVPGLPEVQLRDISAALLHQVLHGFEKDTLSNDDLTRIGQKTAAD
ncbi:hypothetical protein HJFPF1_05985 [Paramyrothecium foliicola]|nr:hypothetical protein HJFPF1_05985 [Paramyrothecium foliicola]